MWDCFYFKMLIFQNIPTKVLSYPGYPRIRLVGGCTNNLLETMFPYWSYVIFMLESCLGFQN